MVTNKLKLLEDTKAKVAKLEKAIAAQLSRELASLPRKYGFSSPQAFLKAFRSTGGFDRWGESYLKDQKEAFTKAGIPFYF